MTENVRIIIVFSTNALFNLIMKNLHLQDQIYMRKNNNISFLNTFDLSALKVHVFYISS